MTTTTTQQIPWAKLPQRVREVLSAEETIDILENIGVKYGLSEMERGFLMRTTGKLLSGALPPTEFVKKIVEDIDIPRDQAIAVAQEINRDIFNEIKDLLLNEVHAGSAPVPKASSASLAPASSPAQPASTNAPTKNIFPPQTSTAGQTHVGSIFEQKLGGVFRMKGENMQYEATPAPSTVQGETLNANSQGLTLNKTDTRLDLGKQLLRSNLVSGGGQVVATPPPVSPKPVFSIPKKPMEVQIPPAQSTQPPK